MSAAAPGTKGRRGFVREETEEPVLAFTLLRGLPYAARIPWILGMAAVGVALQVAALSFWAGAPFLLAATLFAWVVGFDNRLDRRAISRDSAWEEAPLERIAEIRTLDRAMRSWDSSLLDLSSPAGALCFLLAAGALGGGAALLAREAGPGVALILAGDGVLLLLSQWLNGMRRIHRQPDLVLKAEHLLLVVKRAGPRIGEFGEARSMLLMRGKDDTRMPEDVKIVLRPPSPPEGFHGVQGQVVLNRVQGVPHPYFYAVVVAAEGMGLHAATEGWRVPEGLTLERSSRKGVDVIVLRQTTTKTSGYRTDPPVSGRILQGALRIAREFLASAPPPTPPTMAG